MKTLHLLFIFSLFFFNTLVAQSWVARHGLSVTDYQNEFNKWTQQGYRPVNISAYNNRFAVIFEKQILEIKDIKALSGS